MTKQCWYNLTHDADGDEYGWIIATEHNSDLTVYLKGYSLDDLKTACNYFGKGANDYIVLFPASGKCWTLEQSKGAIYERV